MSRLVTDITLDQIDDWFKIGKKVAKSSTVARSKLGGRPLDPSTGKAAIDNTEAPFIPSYRRHARVNNPNQTAYAEHYKQVEMRQMTSGTASAVLPSADGDNKVSTLNDIDLDSTMTGVSEVVLPENQTVEEAVKVYDNYDFQHKYDKSLPISSYVEQVLSTIESNQVTIVQGATGSGKTTQVPQFILDHYAKENKYCNIVVTQPRRIAAISIARRVCSERNWDVGDLCGYQVGMDRVAGEDTRLCYMTTGVLLQKLINQKNMLQYTHVVLDEVHERDQDSDFCLLVVRKLLRTNSRHVKVVLMSATFDTGQFAEYFSLPVRGYLEPATVVKVEGHCYDVAEYYVEDLKSLGELPYLDRDNCKITEESFNLVKELIQQFDNIEIQEQGQSPTGFAKNRGSVLIFLPGLAEINEMDSILGQLITTHGLWILPLHSSITGEEQAKVFYDAPEGKRKVILSTNIAESSITVRDIKYVIDFCLTKNLVADPDTNYTCLQLDWTSKASATQRKGRAGRVSSGRVYRMISRAFWNEVIPGYTRPEMQRCPLEQLVLKSKILDMGEPKAILGLALSPPNLDDIERTVLLLKEVGALSNNPMNDYNPHDGELTFVGHVLAQLPLDIRLGKLLILGHVFGLLEDCLIVAASLSLKSFFAQPFKANLEAYSKKLAWADNSNSDCIAAINAYKVWQQRRITGSFTTRSELKWGKEHMIQIRRIHEVHDLIDDLTKRLLQFNIRLHQRPPRTFDESQNPLLMKLILAGAFYPNFFIRGLNDEKDAARMLSGHSPYTTVMLKGLPANQGTFYKKPIEAIFEKTCSADLQVDFEETRCYVSFGRTTQATTEISMPVYLAVKMRHLRIPLEIALLDEESTRQKLEQLQVLHESRVNKKKLRTNRIKSASDLASAKNESKPHQVALPSAQTTIVPVYITEVVECGHFWGHYGDEDTSRKMYYLRETINHKISLERMTEPLRQGMYCLAPYEDVTIEYYRARVQSIIRTSHGVTVKVFYLDYGNTDNVSQDHIYKIPPELLQVEFQAFECELCNIKPPAVASSGVTWPDESTEFFTHIVAEKVLFAQVYSVIHGVLRVELFEKVRQQDYSINAALVNKGFADKAEESYASKQNHIRRQEEAEYGGLGEDWMEVSLADSTIEGRRRGGKLRLTGPFSPYEMNFYSLTNNGRLRSVRIERDSVNSVALDSEPHDEHDRLLVGCFVSMNPSGNTMMVRDTTILPNIHGLPALLCLLFAPNAELRTDKRKSRYTGAVVGLGCNPETSEPALPDHDIEMTFDTQFDVQDLFMINSVRMAINIAVGSDDSVADWGTDAILKIQTSARRKLMSLIQKQRESVEKYEFPWPYRWNRVDEDDILRPELDSMPQGGVMLNLHCGIALDEPEVDEEEESPQKILEKKRAHVSWLHAKANRSSDEEEIQCQLCNVLCHSPRDLMFHLALKFHRQEESKLMK